VAGFASRLLKGFSSPKEPAYKADSGPYQVAASYRTVVDESRQRKIPMAVYYPKGLASKDSSPVVVMSHGLAGNAATYQYFGHHLASHGYTVLQPTHVGSDTRAVLTRTPVFTFTQGELQERVADIKYTLDMVESGDRRLPTKLTDSADTTRVALAGHSFGAITAMAMAGAEVKDEDGHPIPLGDERLDAFIAMSPYGDSLPSHLVGLDVETYDNITKPVLYLSGSKDGLFTLGKGPTVHSGPFQKTGTDEKYHVVIGGTRHAEFAQVIGILDRRTVEMTESTSTAFLDAHLKKDADARDYLCEQLPAVARTRDSWAFLGSQAGS
jgi:predicted dienelactone hydrolase